VLVAVVEQAGCAVRIALVSPFTKPARDGVMAGTVPPYAMVALLAVMVSVAAVTVKVPGA
jgi:hypothetical protein